MNGSQDTPLWPQHKPDFERLRKVFRRDGIPDRVPAIELFADPEIICAVLGEPLPKVAEAPEQRSGRAVVAASPRAGTVADRQARLRQRIRFCRKIGYDFVWAGTNPPFTVLHLETEDTAALSRVRRGWMNEGEGIIQTWADFETYPWPKPTEIDFFDLDFITSHLPDGMKVVATSGGILEFVMWLMGYTPFALALYDQPDLVEAMFQRVESLLVPIYETVADHENVGAIFLGDDMGHRTGTMIHPLHLRRYVFPRQKHLATIAHDHGLPFLLHSCGDLHTVMDDLIDNVGIDGKHSYEDTYLAVTEAKRLYGPRISILGGIDMDVLVRCSEEEVRAYTRRVLEACMTGGGYAVGSGNTFANYVPIRNYLAMMDETMKLGVY